MKYLDGPKFAVEYLGGVPGTDKLERGLQYRLCKAMDRILMYRDEITHDFVIMVVEAWMMGREKPTGIQKGPICLSRRKT